MERSRKTIGPALCPVNSSSAARDRGRRIPEELSLIGYDNTPLASTHVLRLTTIDGRNSKVGAWAARALLDRMNGRAQPARAELVEPELVIRAPTASPA
jgi:DNA-binding LacI/PurR family transcriptional regulator